MTAPDLFDYRYPDRPGFTDHDTSKAAATAIASRAPSLRERVLTVLQQRWPSSFTADEIAALLNKSELSIRPRVSELHRMGLITPAPHRGRNASGMSAKEWMAVK